MPDKKVEVNVQFTTCSGIKCYYGHCDGDQKVCACNKGFFGEHCEYSFETAFMTILIIFIILIVILLITYLVCRMRGVRMERLLCEDPNQEKEIEIGAEQLKN